MKIEIKVPDLGDGIDEVDVAAVEVAVGATIDANDTLVTLETEKAAMDIPAEVAGTVIEVLVKAGDKLAEGAVLAVVEVADDAGADQAGAAANDQAVDSAASPAPEPDPAPVTEAESVTEAGPVPAPESVAIAQLAIPESAGSQTGSVAAGAHASPAVRHFARELGADLGAVTGSGRKGRITRDDVVAYVKGVLSGGAVAGGGALEPLPTYDFAQWGEIEEVKLSKIRRMTAKNLSRSWPQIPQVTQFDDADVTEMEQFRQAQKALAESRGVRLTALALVMKALVVSLRNFPDFNSSLSADGNGLVLKKYFHIGVAVETPGGLVVPVVRDVDQKGVFEIAADLGDLSARARERKLKPAEMQGSSFTISSLGGIGGTAFTPVVNHPNVAILGLSRSAMKPVWDGNEFCPRLMLPLSLSYDHRVIDGAVAARFIRDLATNLEDIRRLLL